MEHDPKKIVKIKVTDKRRASEAPSDAEDIRTTQEPPASEVPSSAAVLEDTPEAGVSSAEADSGRTSSSAAPEGESDFLDDLRRLQAEFDNYRKRVARESASAGDRAVARVIEDLLPVLDNFERAIAHGEGGEGVQLVFKDLSAALERLGLEEIPAEGAAFDPNVHEAMELRETEGLEEPTVIEVYRRGYMLKDSLIRPASVVVGRPSEAESE